MGHGIDMSNGRANVFYVDETMGDRPLWHKLGDPVKHALTAEDAIVAAGLDWDVGLQEMVAKYDMDGSEIPIPNNFAVVRDDTKAVLSVVGSKYSPIQNKECFGFMDAIAGPERLVQYNTAGSLHGGRKIWLLAELTNLTFEPVPGDVVKPYLALIKGHDGVTPLTSFFTSTRIVCQNTANMALSTARKNKDAMVKIRHTQTAMNKVEEAQRILGLAVERAEEYSEVMQSLAKKQLTPWDWNAFLESLFPLPELEEGKETSRALTIATKRHDQLTELFEAGLGTDIPGVRGTAWGAYNAITEFTTHHAQTRTGLDKSDPRFERARNESLLSSSWFGTGAKLNKKALDLLIAA